MSFFSARSVALTSMLVIMLAFCPALYGQSIEIDALQAAKRDSLVRATMVVPDGTASFAWKVKRIDKEGSATPVEFQEYDNGQSIVFAGPVGTYFLTGAAIVDMKMSLGEATVLIIDDSPTPKPEPDKPDPHVPVPVPNPSGIPDDRFDNVGKAVYSSASKMTPAARAQASALATLYRTAVSKMKSLELVNATAAQNYVRAEREKLWGPNSVEWTTAFAPATERWNKQQLTKQTVMDFYEAVAAGLEHVK